MTLTYRRTKGSQLTSAEADGNVDHLLQSSNLSFLQSGSTQSRTVQAKLREFVHAKDIDGVLCDGSHDDGPAISAYVTGNSNVVILFPPGSTTMTSVVLPFRNNCGYACVGGRATIKAHASSTDNVVGEHQAGTQAYSGIFMQNITVDGNRTNCSYNTRNGGVTDDNYQNGVLIEQISDSEFVDVWTQNTVMNGFVLYNLVSDVELIRPRAVNIGKASNPAAGAHSHMGIDLTFGMTRINVINPYVNTCRDSGIRSAAEGADNQDVHLYHPQIYSAAGDAGIRIADDSGTNIHYRTKIIAPVVKDCTGVGIRLQPNSTGTIDDCEIVAPMVHSCSYGIVTGGIVNRAIITAPNIRSNTNTGISIGASAVDCQIVGGVSLSNGTAFSDSGTRTLAIALNTATGNTIEINKGLTFPATQVASADVNTLDDYEEGTFTPTIVGTGTAGAGTYTSQTGTYTTIGNVVHFHIFIVWTAHTGVGNLRVAGLPFTSTAHNTPVTVLADGLTFANQLGGLQLASATTIDLYTQSTGAGIAAVALDTAATLYIQGTYRR